MGMHATKDRVESNTSTVYSISLYKSTMTTRDEPWFGELKLALGVIGLPVTARDRILRCSPPSKILGKKVFTKILFQLSLFLRSSKIISLS
ncbi:hypothetical protein BC332_02525 [Capsicum chinense]|nr:hypothetical protein BC332_02525 [Capsicum chinense]